MAHEEVDDEVAVEEAGPTTFRRTARASLGWLSIAAGQGDANEAEGATLRFMSSPRRARQEFEAVYESGVFRPLTRPTLPEGARVHLFVEVAPAPSDPLELAGQVFDGLTPEDIAEVEAIILDRSNFFGDLSPS
jgi:predicted DNA-binding antitoxin AbrB/MazE fold protein